MEVAAPVEVVSFSVGEEVDPAPRPGLAKVILEAESVDVIVDVGDVAVVLEMIDEATVVLVTKDVVVEMTWTDTSEGNAVDCGVGFA